jgi:hypothetical protein
VQGGGGMGGVHRGDYPSVRIGPMCRSPQVVSTQIVQSHLTIRNHSITLSRWSTRLTASTSFPNGSRA